MVMCKGSQQKQQHWWLAAQRECHVGVCARTVKGAVPGRSGKAAGKASYVRVASQLGGINQSCVHTCTGSSLCCAACAVSIGVLGKQWKAGKAVEVPSLSRCYERGRDGPGM